MNERDEAAIKAAMKAMSHREQMDVVKAAVKELLADYAKAFGWWSLRCIAVAFVGAVFIFIVWTRQLPASYPGG